MNEPKLFDFHGQKVRITTIDHEPYFVGKDVAEILGYSNTKDALSRHIDDEDKRGSRFTTPSGIQTMTVINESGLYSLILSSKLPTAKEFKRWVTAEVLPTIRRYGAYMTDSKIEEVLSDPDTIIELATRLKEERSGRLIAEQQVKELQPKADYYDTILANKGLVSTTSIAKNYGMAASAFNQLLHRLGIQFNQSGSWYLYSKYHNHGYTHTVPVAFKHRDGRDDVKPNTKWTQKGHVFLYEELKKNGVMPVIEKKGMTV